MENEIKEIISMAYKNRFSLYYKPGYCIMRIYRKDGSQHKEIGENMEEAINKTLTYLKFNKNY